MEIRHLLQTQTVSDRWPLWDSKTRPEATTQFLISLMPSGGLNIVQDFSLPLILPGCFSLAVFNLIRGALSASPAQLVYFPNIMLPQYSSSYPTTLGLGPQLWVKRIFQDLGERAVAYWKNQFVLRVIWCSTSHEHIPISDGQRS